MTGRISKLADAVVNTAIVVAAAIVMLAVFAPSAAREPSSPGEPGRPGQPPAVPALDYEKADTTVLLVLSSSCQYCADSMPALRKIAEACTRTRGRTRCVVVSGESESSLRAYVESHGLKVSGLYSVSPGSTALVEYTPRVVLVGRDAKVRQDWLGFLDIGRADEVSRTILGGTTSEVPQEE